MSIEFSRVVAYHWVYNRAGEPCRICNQAIQKIKLGGRSSHYCPQCQPQVMPK